MASFRVIFGFLVLPVLGISPSFVAKAAGLATLPTSTERTVAVGTLVPTMKISPTLAPPTPTRTPTLVPPTPTRTPTLAPPTPTRTPTLAPPTPTRTPTLVPPTPTRTPTLAPPTPTRTPTTPATATPTPTATSAYSDVNVYAEACVAAGLGSMPKFDCRKGTLVPSTKGEGVTSRECSFANNDGCHARNRMLRVEQGDATWIALCRVSGNAPENYWTNVGVIAYSSKTGASCFFEADPQKIEATSTLVITPTLPPPGLTGAEARRAASTYWHRPDRLRKVSGGNCTSCHDSDIWVHSPWIDQVTSANRVPGGLKTSAYWVVGDILDPPKYTTQALRSDGKQSACFGCHKGKLSSNNMLAARNTGGFYIRWWAQGRFAMPPSPKRVPSLKDWIEDNLEDALAFRLCAGVEEDFTALKEGLPKKFDDIPLVERTLKKLEKVGFAKARAGRCKWKEWPKPAPAAEPCRCSGTCLGDIQVEGDGSCLRKDGELRPTDETFRALKRECQNTTEDATLEDPDSLSCVSAPRRYE